MKGQVNMQINNNFNRANTQQFGMALRVKPGGEQYLQNKTIGYFKRLVHGGKDMCDFKHYDLEIHGDGLRVVNKLTGEYYLNPHTESCYRPIKSKSYTDLQLFVKSSSSSQDINKTFDLKTNDKAIKAYNVFENGDILDRQILLTQLLEKEAIENLQHKRVNLLRTILNKFYSK